MIKICKNCQKEFEITDEDLTFYDKISPVFNGVNIIFQYLLYVQIVDNNDVLVFETKDFYLKGLVICAGKA